MGNQPAVERTHVRTVVAKEGEESVDADLEAMRKIRKFLPTDRTSLKKPPVSFSTLRKSQRVRCDVLAGKEESLAQPLVSICAQYREFCRRWAEPTMHNQDVLTVQINSLDAQAQQAVGNVRLMHDTVVEIEHKIDKEVPSTQDIARQLVVETNELLTHVERLNALLPQEHRLLSFSQVCSTAGAASEQARGP